MTQEDWSFFDSRGLKDNLLALIQRTSRTPEREEKGPSTNGSGKKPGMFRRGKQFSTNRVSMYEDQYEIRKW